MTPQRRAAAVRAAVDEPRYGARAKELARLLDDDDGAVARRIERLTG